MTEIKLRQLAEADKEYAQDLKAYCQSEGLTDYLDMSLQDFLKHSLIKFERLENRAKELFLERFGVKST